ncbi:MAG: T9SS type A sorting domain-containing protein [Bacteroidia bacterium]
MITKPLYSIPALLSFIMLFFSSANAQTGYTAHEWGTFTTLCGSTGHTLNGLYLEEESLPNFVYSHKGFVPNPVIEDEGTKEERRYFMFCDNVSVKMETPVIYFYADKSVDVNVRVDFPYGTISQWYPQRTTGDNIGNTLDLRQKHNGFIEWKSTIQAPGNTIPFTPKPADVTNTWSAPRATDANNVTANGETEKYLFYRGVGNFGLPIKMKFITSAELAIKNTGSEDIPFFFVYDKKNDGKVALWWTGKIKTGETKTAHEPVKYYLKEELADQFKIFEDELVKAGLYRKEAAAMLNTWEQSYFGTTGLKVFWIVPRTLTDDILPLQLDPQPENLERVLVGRSEIIKPQLEKELIKAYQADKYLGKWKDNRYYQAYLERMAYLNDNPYDTVPIVKATQTGVNNSLAAETIQVYPNPATNALTLDISQLTNNNITISLYNMLGVQVYTFTQVAAPASYKHNIDINTFPAGNYILRIETGRNQHISRIVKQ